MIRPEVTQDAGSSAAASEWRAYGTSRAGTTRRPGGLHFRPPPVCEDHRHHS